MSVFGERARRGTYSEPKNLASLPSARLTIIQGNPNALCTFVSLAHDQRAREGTHPFFSTCSVASALTRSFHSVDCDSSMYSLSLAAGMRDAGMMSPKLSGFAAFATSPALIPQVCSCQACGVSVEACEV